MNMPVSILPGIGLTEREREQLEALANALSPDRALWASGFLAGVAHARLSDGVAAASAPHIVPSPDTAIALTILYASETGNAAELARRVEARAQGLGLKAVASDLASYKQRNLKDERLILLISSTHGEGEPPEPAAGFFEFLAGRKAPKLDGARFAVLGLGDTTYEFFCEAAKRLDRRLEELGASRFHDRLDCDVDYEEPAEAWIEALLEKLRAEQAAAGAARPVPAAGIGVPSAVASFDKRNPFLAPVVENLVITGRGSSKETRHIEFALEGSGLSYEPGDALGILPRNDPALVEELLERCGFTGGETVTVRTGEIALAEALSREFEITALTPRFLQRWTELSGAEDLARLTSDGDRAALAAFMHANHVIDVVRRHPVPGLDASGMTAALRGLQPRLYSIASSALAVPDEVHITVSSVRYVLQEIERTGVASCYLADRVRPDDTVPVYIQRNDNFRLPKDGDTPIVMIGAGTGVAPYRAFVQQREAEGASARSWLFFGERNFRTDFLYQTEWQDWLKDGVLARMDVAFSRDQAEKRYIQHVMLERGAELFAWLEEGAHLYLCGDAEKLAPDAHEALLSIVETHGAMTRESAEEYLRELQHTGRYQRDVY
jgi:sulfite reductase (NADPH) flavoprotein alpha-component